MVSNLKSETARANGAKSRGPTTAEGKEKSSRNSLKHGLTAGGGNILLDCEDPDEFQEIFNKLLGIHEPATPAENDLVQEMFAARWRIHRMWTIETNLFNVEILTEQSKTDSPNPGIHLAMAYRALSDDSHALALASRYEARLQRTYDQAYKTLRELQQARKSEPPKQPHTVHVKWVDRKDEPDQNYNPAPNPSATPTPEPELPNEPTVAANKEVNVPKSADPSVQPVPDPPIAADSTPKSEIRNLKSEIRNPASPGDNAILSR